MDCLEITQKIKAHSESAAQKIVDAFREESSEKGYSIKKASIDHRTKKSKGEIIDELWLVTITQVFGELWEE